MSNIKMEDQTVARITEMRMRLARAARNAVEPDALVLADIMDELVFLMLEIVDRLPPHRRTKE